MTIILYFSLLALLAAATIYLVMRDLNAAAEEREREVLDSQKALQRLPTPVEDTVAGPVTDRIDHSLRRLLYQSGMDISAEAAFLLCVLVGLLVGGVLFIWTDEIVAAVVGFVLGMGLPLLYFSITRRQRLEKIREQLPDAMDLMARSVRAGETLDQAIENVGRTEQAPLSVEFARCGRQLEMGLALPAAMRGLTQRAPITEMRILSTALTVQRRTGGNLAAILDRLAHVVRDRMSYHRQFMASTGASRLATLIISMAGPLVFAYMMVYQPDYMGQFFQLPGGTFLLVLASVLQIVGLVWVWRLMRNDY